MKKLSVVIPIYNEIGIEANIMRVVNILDKSKIKHEIILVDDGSTNLVWNEISTLVGGNDNIIGIAFSRNFGKESALCAGLDIAKGDCAVCLDSDMQFPPEVIPDMYALWEQGYEVVEGIKKRRQNEGLIYKVCSKTFYKVLKKMSGIDLNNGSDFRLLDRVAIDAWKEMPEKQTFFRGMSSWVGFKRVQYEFDVEERIEGESKWSPRTLIALAIDAVTSYTAAPLYLASIFGVIFLFFAIVMGIQTLWMKISGGAASGFTTVILLQLFVGAIVLIGLGVVGIYIKKIYEEVKNRPRYIIGRIIGGAANDRNDEV